MRVATILVLGVLMMPVTLSAQQRRRAREPQLPPPSITEYKPRSTLVVPEHTVPRAKFPAVDFHGHPPNLSSVDNVNQVVAAMDELNLQVIVQAPAGSGERLRSQIEGVRETTGRTGPLAFVTLRHDITQNGDLTVTEYQDLVLRRDPSPAAPNRRTDWDATAIPSGAASFPILACRAGCGPAEGSGSRCR